jgi:hypothetical protein
MFRRLGLTGCPQCLNISRPAAEAPLVLLVALQPLFGGSRSESRRLSLDLALRGKRKSSQECPRVSEAQSFPQLKSSLLTEAFVIAEETREMSVGA